MRDHAQFGSAFDPSLRKNFCKNEITTTGLIIGAAVELSSLLLLFDFVFHLLDMLKLQFLHFILGSVFMFGTMFKFWERKEAG